MENLQELTTFDAKLFGRRVALRRKKLKISQTKLAEEIGISQQHLSGIEHANDSISFEVFLRLCTALEVNPDYLLGGTLRMNNIPQNVVDNLNHCSLPDQELAADFIELLRNRNQKNK